MGLFPKFVYGIASPDGNSPKGFTITPKGMPQSFCIIYEFGIRSVVVLSKLLSVLYALKSSPSKGALDTAAAVYWFGTVCVLPVANP